MIIKYDSYSDVHIDRWGESLGFVPDIYRMVTWWLVIRCDAEHSKRRPKDWFNPHYEDGNLHCDGNGMQLTRPRRLKNRTSNNEYRKITKELWI